MKNVKKLLKKAMVFTLAASMLVGTPLTASAAGIRGVYSVSDGTNQSGDDKSHTGTVTNTDTGTNSGVLKDNDAKIIGIALDKEYVKAEKGVKETLKATIVLDGTLVGKENATVSEEAQKEILKQIEKKIKWEVLYADGDDRVTVKDNVAANKVLSIEAKATDRTVVTLNPRQGTVDGEEMIVRATINGSYWHVKNADGEVVVEELKDNKTEDYTAEAKVSIKEYTDKLFFDGDKGTEVVEPMPPAYVKQSLNLNDYIVRKPETANDEITWISTNTKVATVTAAGVVTFKKVNAKENAEGELELTAAKDACQIIAVGERGGEAKDTWDVYVEAGTPASKIVIMDATTNKIFTDGKKADNKKAALDISNDEDRENGAYVVKYAKVNAAVDTSGNRIVNEGDLAPDSKGKYKSKSLELEEGTAYIEVSKDGKSYTVKPEDSWIVTDTITWTSNKPAIVKVDPYGDDTTLYAIGVGTAAITAKASSGKSDKVTVTVKATLKDLWIANQKGDQLVGDVLYSGKSLQLYVGRDPEENKDAVKWSIEQETVDKKDKNGNVTGQKKVKNPNATINAKGVLTIKPKLDLSDAEYSTVTVVLEPKKKVLDLDGNEIKDTVTFTVEQSSIDGIAVRDDKGDLIAEVATTYNNKNVGKVAQTKLGAANTTYISVPKNRTYTATVKPSKNVYGEDEYQAGSDTLTWTTSNAKVASIEYDGGTAKITANASGTATITVSGVRAVNQKKGDEISLKSASVIKTTFKVSVKQPVKTVTLNKSSVALNKKTKKVGKNVQTADQKVALKATLGPKGVGKKELIHWSVKENGELLTNAAALGLEKKGKEVTSASVSVNLPTPEIGDVFEITATAESGASATSVVTIVSTTTGVQIQNAVDHEIFTKYDAKKKKDIANTKELRIGESIQMETVISTAAKGQAANWELAGKKVSDNDVRETVTYSVNKKGIVNIDQNTGKVYAIKDGKVTITAKTPLGKTAKLTVEVSK